MRVEEIREVGLSQSLRYMWRDGSQGVELCVIG